MEEESFRVRVDKVFGSLLASSSSSLWCLTDEEVERREWNHRERDIESQPPPYPSNLDGFFVNQQQNKSDIDDDEQWNIRSAVGIDSTLDLEEEEDEHDKVAVGGEKVADRFYMTDIADYGIEITSNNEFPTTFMDVTRDPRANHTAAKIRLKEDAEEAEKLDSLQVSDNTMQSAVDAQDNTPEDGVSLKSILKRKANKLDPKLQKHVGFDPVCKAVCEEESQGGKGLAMETCSMKEDTVPEEVCVLPQDHYGVPDYVRNPWGYTHYTFDSLNDIDEESNRKAYMDFINMIKRSNNSDSQPDDTLIDHPKSITFTPKKKPGDKSVMENGNEFKQNQENVCEDQKDWCIRIVTGYVEEDEVCAMEEDEQVETIVDTTSNMRRPGRQYRTKAKIELDEPVN